MSEGRGNANDAGVCKPPGMTGDMVVSVTSRDHRLILETAVGSWKLLARQWAPARGYSPTGSVPTAPHLRKTSQVPHRAWVSTAVFRIIPVNGHVEEDFS